jgi:hypothetical protein
MTELTLFNPTPKRRGTSVHGTTLRVEVGRRTCWLYGPGVRPVLDAVGAPRQWDHTRRWWMTAVDRADDVIAWAEYKQRRHVTVEAVQR